MVSNNKYSPKRRRTNKKRSSKSRSNKTKKRNTRPVLKGGSLRLTDDDYNYIPQQQLDFIYNLPKSQQKDYLLGLRRAYIPEHEDVVEFSENLSASQRQDYLQGTQRLQQPNNPTLKKEKKGFFAPFMKMFKKGY